VRQVERTPLGVWAGELSSEVCDRIIEEGKVLAQQIATINKDNNIDSKFRDGKVAWFNKGSWVDRLLSYYANETNNKEWGFNLNNREQPQFTTYNENDFYTWHRDSDIESDIQRKLSVTVQLSDINTYSGGDFKLKTCWGNKDVDLSTVKKRGSIFIFPSFLLHEVTPVSQGTRYSLVQWYSGPPFT